MQVNEITFAGYLGKDAEFRSTPGGKDVATFSLAHTEKGKDGREDVTTWVRVEAWGGWATSASRYRKGDNVIVKGKLGIDLYKDKSTGADRTTVKIIAFSLGLLTKEEASRGTSYGQAPADFAPPPVASPPTSALDDIPF